MIEGSSKEEYLTILNQLERCQLKKQDLLIAATGAGVENLHLLGRWYQSNKRFFENVANLEEAWNQKFASAEEEHKEHADRLKGEILEAQQDSKTQTKAAIEAQTKLSQAISESKSSLAVAKKWETVAGNLSSEVDKLKSENRVLIEQLAVVRADKERSVESKNLVLVDQVAEANAAKEEVKILESEKLVLVKQVAEANAAREASVAALTRAAAAAAKDAMC